MYDPGKIYARLEEIAQQGRQNASNLELISTKLFGSEEDHFAAGRLPVLEKNCDDLRDRIGIVETARERGEGRRDIMGWVVRGAGKALLAALAALAGAIFGSHLHR